MKSSPVSEPAVALPHGESVLASQSSRRVVFLIVVYAILLAGSVAYLAPFLWMVTTSLKDPKGLFALPPQLIPDPVRWQNYTDAWVILPFTRYFANTTMLTVHNIVASLASSAL